MSEGADPETEAPPATEAAADEPAPPRRRRGPPRALWLAVAVLVVFAAGVALWPVILPRLGSEAPAAITVLDSADLEARLGGIGARIEGLENASGTAEESRTAAARRLDALERGGEAAGVTLAEIAAGTDTALAQGRALERRLGDLERAGAALEALAERLLALETALAESLEGDRDGGAVAALEQRLGRIEAALAEGPEGGNPSAAAVALANRLDRVEAALAERAGRAIAPTAETGALVERLTAVEARLDGAREVGDAVAALGEDAARLGDRLSVDTARIAALEATAAAGDPHRVDLVLAIGRLRQALAGSGPFADDLALVVELGAGEAGFAAPLEVLAVHAEDGVPARSVLRARFAAAARGAIQAERDAAAGDWFDKTVARLGRLVSVRRTGEIAGAASDAILARAETRLGSGDLAAAVAELGALEGDAAAAVAEWLGAAEARLAAERALEDMTAAAARGG